MRILVVSPHPPRFPGGGSSGRLYFLIRELSKYHTVDLIAGECWDGEVDRAVLAGLCERVAAVKPLVAVVSGPSWLRRLKRWWRWWFGVASDIRDVMRISAAVEMTIRDWANSAPPDLVYVHHSMSHPLVQGLLPGVPVIVDLHNIMFHYYQRSIDLAPSIRAKLQAWREFFKMKRFESKLFLSGAAFAVCSEQDEQIVRSINPEALVRVVPNGVDTEHFQGPHGGSQQDLLFLGTLSYLPNSDAVEYFVKSILPLVRQRQPQARLRIVGAAPPKQVIDLHNGVDVFLIGQVPDVRPHALASAIHLVPLRLGSGTRLKILEALAMGRAVVSTSIGAEGLDLIDGTHVLLADDPNDFAGKIVDLMENNELRLRLASEGQRLAQERYDWIFSGEKLRDLCQQSV